MDRPEIESRLAELIRSFFELPDLAIGADTTADQVDGWDSVAHVGFIVAVEKSFGVRFTTREIKTLARVGDLVDLLGKRLG